MDDITEDSIPQNCIILTPEELARLGIKIKKPQLSTSTENAKKENMEESTDNIASSLPDSNEELTNFKNSIGSRDKDKNVSHDNHTKKESNSVSKRSNKDNNLDSYNNGGITKEKRKSQSAVIEKYGRRKPKNLLPPITIGNHDDINVNAMRLRCDQDTSVNSALESSDNEKDKNDEIETSEVLSQNVNNSPSNSENRTLKNKSLKDDLEGSAKVATSSIRSEASIRISEMGAQKGGRENARKSLLKVNNGNVLDGNVYDNTDETILSKQKNANNESVSETISQPESNGSRTSQKRRIKNYKVLCSDSISNSESDYGSDLDSVRKAKAKKRKKIGLKKILDSDDSDTTCSNNKFILKQKDTKSNDMQSNLVPLDNNINVSLDTGTETIITEDIKTPKKRGRPKKNSLEANKPLVRSSSLVNEHKEVEELVTTSKRGRKRKQFNYSLLENPDFSEYDNSGDSGTNCSNNKFMHKQKHTKSDDMQSNLDPLDNNINVSLDTGTETIITEDIRTPKKRGRPKKNSLEANKSLVRSSSLVNKHKEVEELVTTSKRGRKRKQFNYSLLENPDFPQYDGTENSAGPKKRGRRKQVSSEVYIKREAENNDSAFENVVETEPFVESTGSKKRRRSKKVSSEMSVKKEADHDDLSPENSIESASFKKSAVAGKLGGSKKVSSEISIKNESIEEITNSEEIKKLPSSDKEEAHSSLNEPSNDNATSTKQGSSRYKWTGNLTKAINQMFNVINDNSVTDTGDDNPLIGKTKRMGRPKSNSDYLIDEEGSSVCMVCNETIPTPEWPEHRREIHYNLAWRKGDWSLDLTNEEFVLKTLRQLVRQQRYIKCNRCSKKIRDAKKFVAHLDICNGVVNSSGCVTCAVCKVTMEKSNWKQHKYRKHNNLSWREGEPPLNLDDRDLVMRILNALYKTKKPLHCEKCDLQKRSVLGYLSHKSTCQKTDEELENIKVACHICEKKVLPVSMDWHLKTHEEKKEQFPYISEYSSYFDVSVDITGKRRAAAQALEVINSFKHYEDEESKYYISQCDFRDSRMMDILRENLQENLPLKCIFFDCDFSADVVESIADHMNSCAKKPNQYFVCKMCLSWYKEEPAMHDHIKDKHNKLFKSNQDAEFKSDSEVNDSEEDDILDEDERRKKKLRLTGKQKIFQTNAIVKPHFLVHPMRERRHALIYPQAYVWMLEFCVSNYSRLNLYPNFRNNRPWQVLDCDILNDYLPKNLQSCDIAARLITTKENTDNLDDLTFRKFELFEVSDFYQGDVTIYCGGPISALAWLPTPYDQNHNQVLAVAVFNSTESYYTVDKNYYEPYVIQFWDFGILNCHEITSMKPSLLFGIALTCGPIWHLEWCPSGCLDCSPDNTTYRLGLLAVAAADSFVYIYSVDNLDVNDRGFIYKGEPVLKLQLESEKSSLGGQAYYPTRISWSKAADHKYIAVGYSTGFVALYDIFNESLLLQQGNPSGPNIVFPYHSFQAHLSSITGLTLSHLRGGNRFLFTTSFDRTSLFWDLSTTAKIVSFKKNSISEGVWMTLWPAYLVAEDESTFSDNLRARTCSRILRNLMCPDTTNFTYAMSGIRTLCYSDWLNTILHGGNGGEVMAQFTHRMFCNVLTKSFKKDYRKCLFSLTKLVKKDGANPDLALTYNEAASKYKVVFLDYDLTSVNNVPTCTVKDQLKPENLSMCDIREYSLQSINKIAVNPNPQACSFYATGYRAGFIRLRSIQFVSRLIPKH